MHKAVQREVHVRVAWLLRAEYAAGVSQTVHDGAADDVTTQLLNLLLPIHLPNQMLMQPQYLIQHAYAAEDFLCAVAAAAAAGAA